MSVGKLLHMELRMKSHTGLISLAISLFFKLWFKMQYGVETLSMLKTVDSLSSWVVLQEDWADLKISHLFILLRQTGFLGNS